MGHCNECQLYGLRILTEAYERTGSVASLDILMLYLENNGCLINEAIEEVNKL